MASRASDRAEVNTPVSLTSNQSGEGRVQSSTGNHTLNPFDGTSEKRDDIQDNGEEDVEATPRPLRPADLPTRSESVSASGSSTRGMSPTPSQSSLNRQVPIRNSANSTRELEDLQTKLRVLEKHRLQDREKLKVLERIQQERDKFESIIQKLQQKYQPQQQELNDLKTQLKISEERMSGIENTKEEHDAELESAALDREMAEEQYEVAKAELAALRERFEEMELEVEVLREENQELGKEMSTEEKTSQGWLQLERSNERYREALIRLRDVTQEQEAELKQQISILEKDLETLSGIDKEADELKVKMLERDAVIDDLKQQLEISENSEEMLEDLSERNMALQERIENLNNIINDLENLKELNDELEVNHVEAEKQMQDEIEYKDSIIGEQLRRSQEQQKALDDCGLLVTRFREAFSNLQTDLEEMRTSKQMTDMEAEELSGKSRALADLNMKLQSSAAKSLINGLDWELQKLEATEAVQHLSIIKQYLPDTYQEDKDAVLALLRCKRVAFKSMLIKNNIKEKLGTVAVEFVFAGIDITKHLFLISVTCQRLADAIETCNADDLSRFATAFFELEPLERGLNNYIDQFRKDEFALKRIDNELERHIAVLNHFYSTVPINSSISFAYDIHMKAELVQNYLDIIFLSLQHCKALNESSGHENERHQNTSDNDIENTSTTTIDIINHQLDPVIVQARTAKVVAAKISRELKELFDRSMCLNDGFLTHFDNINDFVSQVNAYVQNLANNLCLKKTESIDGYIKSSDLLDIFTNISSSSNSGPLSTINSQLCTMIEKLNILYTQTTDMSCIVEVLSPPAPWTQRAQSLHQESQVSSKAAQEVSRLKDLLKDQSLIIRSKDGELDESAVRIEMLEARMSAATLRSNKIEELQTRLETSKSKESELAKEIERLGKEGKRLRDERDQFRKKIHSSDVDKQILLAGENNGIGKAGLLELERKAVQIRGLEAAVRLMHSDRISTSQVDIGGPGDVEWLYQPLIPPTPVDKQKLGDFERDTRQIMLSLVDITINAKQISISTANDNGNRLRWKPARETPTWIHAKNTKDFSDWCHGRDVLLENVTHR